MEHGLNFDCYDGWEIVQSTVMGATGGVSLGAIVKFAKGAKAAKAAKNNRNRFPENPDDLLPDLPRDAKGRIYPSDKVRIRPEKHPVKPGETYSPRHHGQHYHVETRTDPTKSWNNKNNTTKVKPPEYQRGEGTGFLPGEKFPGAQ
ncbi:MAG: hypothetical protein G3M70_10155 [Candidatus Nitronauta litoralis]|uniref:Uncharacterized protein n=1 Tax=Candidatus Nitronauta litoralis TaxID=2705533 RepID=A0A7T0BXB3_9BACT|nr:MAG: hypothetical protein G3M70_10155 [Candidatus Nitronauta litoralis]